MKKIIIIISSAVLVVIVGLVIVFSALGKKDLTDMQEFINNIYSSEETLAGYHEVSKMFDDDFLVYNKETNCKVQRGKSTSSQVEILEKKLSTKGDVVYDETSTKYETINETKYVNVDGVIYQNTYQIPTYYLTFVMSEEFLEEGYTFERNNDDFTLKAKVLDNKISSLFLNKSVGNLTDFQIEIVMKDKKLQSFNCRYMSENGFNVEIQTEYFYAQQGNATVIFHLEGGICQTSKEDITYVYPFNGTFNDCLIADPNVLETDDKNQIKKDGFHIEGWYQTKIENPDGTITYKDKWDFAESRIDLNGVELYANWKKNSYYGYELHYINEDNQDINLGGYQVSEGQKFNIDFINNSNVEGFTTIGLLDESGNTWDSNFTHPGGDEDLTIKVYLVLVKGEYKVVSKVSEFNSAIAQNQNIYLLNDLDFNNESISFASYSGIIEGNNHQLSNYQIYYSEIKDDLQADINNPNSLTKDYLYISLFFKLENATIRNVQFNNMTIDLNISNPLIKHIIISPLAITSSNTSLENVKVNGKIVINKIPECEIIYGNTSFWYQNENVTVDENCQLNVNIE